MTDYIASVKTIALIPELKDGEKAYLIAKDDEMLSVSDLKLIMDKYNSNLSIKTYSLKEELILAIGSPMILNSENTFVLLDANFPDIQMFGERVTKLTVKTPVEKVKTKTKKRGRKPKADIKNKKENSENAVQEELELKTSEIGQTPIKEHDELSLPKLSEDNQPSKEVEEVDEETKRLNLANDVKKLLNVDYSDFGSDIPEVSFYLVISSIIGRSSSVEEAKDGIMFQDDSGKLWEAVEPHFEDIKKLIAPHK